MSMAAPTVASVFGRAFPQRPQVIRYIYRKGRRIMVVIRRNVLAQRRGR